MTLVVVLLAAAACTRPAGSTATAASVPLSVAASASAAEPTASPTRSYPPYKKAVVAPADGAHPRRGPANPVIATAYPFDIYAHCGAELVKFGGSNWLAEQPLRTEATSYIAGTMELLDADTARFVIDLRYIDELALSGPPVEVVIYHKTTDAVGCM